MHVAAAVTLVLTPVLAATGQVAVSPFVSYVPSAATNPLAGFALTFGGTTGLALRAGAEMAISNPRVDSAAQPGGYRPWGADADAMLFLGGLGGGAAVAGRGLTPYGFAGIGLAGQDSAGKNVISHGWSYGAGASLPLGFDADVFAEARWRMPTYVLPTSEGAPDSRRSFRFGLSFRVGGSSAPAAYPPRRRHAVAQPQDDVEYVVTPAPASPPVVVVQPAPAASPEVVVVEQDATPAPEQVVVVQRERERATQPATVIRESSPTLRRPPARVTPRRVVVTTESRSTTRVQTRGAARTTVRAVQESSRARRAKAAKVAAAKSPRRVQVQTEARQRRRLP